MASSRLRGRSGASALAAVLLLACDGGVGRDAAATADGGGPPPVDAEAGDAETIPLDAGPLPVADVAPLTLQGQSALVLWFSPPVGACRLELVGGPDLVLQVEFGLGSAPGPDTLFGIVIAPGTVQIIGGEEADGTPLDATGTLTVEGVGVVHDSLLQVDPTDLAQVSAFVTSLFDAGGVQVIGAVDIGATSVPLGGYQEVGCCNDDLPAFVGPESADLSGDPLWLKGMICAYAGSQCTCEPDL